MAKLDRGRLTYSPVVLACGKLPLEGCALVYSVERVSSGELRCGMPTSLVQRRVGLVEPWVRRAGRIDIGANPSGVNQWHALISSIPTGRGILSLIHSGRGTLSWRPELRGNNPRYFNSPLRDPHASTCGQRGMRRDTRTRRLRDLLGTLRQSTLLTGGAVRNSEAGSVPATGSPRGNSN
ncbi:hypothetical protein R1flu_028520 [Riccia fluitans]|uniref:Uncharacterized protein n=1 Tax=Riccia fluitans TaxID=41844 RepID=A0ABD1XLX9_9MARC